MFLAGRGHRDDATTTRLDPAVVADLACGSVETAGDESEGPEDHVHSLSNNKLQDGLYIHASGTLSQHILGIEKPHVYVSGGGCYNVGSKHSRFGNGRLNLVANILGCVFAHKKAFAENCPGTYADIIGPPKGFVDGKTKEGNHQFNRTGTWQFASVHALVDFARMLTVSDDLESFFHVMLYFAIRFLPHNASDVTSELLYSYFDDCTNGKNGETSGSTKYMAMHSDRIDLTRFTASKVDKNGGSTESLTFLWPDVNATSSGPTEEVIQHPIDLVISDLLQWFKALYAQDRKVVTKRLGVPKSDDKRVLGHLSLALPGMQLPATPLISPVVQIQPTESQRLARNLKTHDAMIQLLMQYITRVEWPEEDKDKGGYTRPGDNTPTTSTRVDSKRVMQDGAEPSSKRARSEART